MTDLNKERMELELSAGVLDRQIDNLKAEIADEYFDDEKLELLIEYAMKLGEVYAQRDLLEKAKAQAVPEGYVVVPKEPTDKMLKRGNRLALSDSQYRYDAASIYEVMLEASESGAEG
ncbi:hypothetical protein [Acinetobacter baumannii]|uniref:hypothetical protein n=1 Tax=Acinetobacter baumannii TaxID=470 RepID=UPI0022284814|nr:hypothetical protein [Acinetobacter baumannii]MCW3176257.1 hypothetical protein [Acinetobacter baumannii]